MEQILEFKVPAMTCGHCEAAVKAEIGKVGGVDRVTVDLATKVVIVAGSELDESKIFAAVDEAGFEATR
jgi:copper chaperone